MIVRIRFGKGPTLSAERRKQQKLAHAFGALLTPVALMALALGLWRLAAELKWAGTFAITSGIFSYWETWVILAAALQLGSRALSRTGKNGNQAPV